jgi:PAS domain S-box-containing protein
MLQYISVGIIGFALAGCFYSLLSAWARRSWNPLILLAVLAFLVAANAYVGLTRRGCADLALGIELTRWIEIIHFAGYALLPFIYRSLCNQKPGWIDLSFTLYFAFCIVLAYILSDTLIWKHITAMVPADLGLWGLAYHPEGTARSFAKVANSMNIIEMIYLTCIAWIPWRKGTGSGVLVFAVPVPLVIAAIYFTGNQQGWWQLPTIGEVFPLGVFLVIWTAVFSRERALVLERDRLYKNLEKRTTSLFLANQKLSASDQQLRASNIMLIAEVDQRAKTEIALREAENRYRALFDNSVELIGLLNPQGTLLEINQTALDLAAVGSDDVVGKPLWEGPWWAHDKEELAKCKKAVLDAASGETVRLETTHATPNGELHYIDFTMKPIPGEFGSVRFLISEGRDITLKKRAQKEADERQQQLIYTDKMASLGLMVSGIAHEINNPNNLIMLNADVMEKMWIDMRKILDNTILTIPQSTFGGIQSKRAIERFETMLKGISGGSKRIMVLVSSLKGFARTDNEGLTEIVNMRAVVESAVMILDHSIQKATNNFSISFDPDLPPIFGSYQKIEQVIINLLTNGCESLTDPNQSLSVNVWYDRVADDVVVDVEDTGCGIPQEIQGKVMDPFFTTKGDSGGTGLGLSVSYGIIKDHNGTIGFTSQPGKGTCFTIKLKAHHTTNIKDLS